MKLLCSLALVSAEFSWSESLLQRFKCDQEETYWQLPEECGSECTEADKKLDRYKNREF